MNKIIKLTLMILILTCCLLCCISLAKTCDHEWVLYKSIPATCVDWGEDYYKCKKCGKKADEPDITMPDPNNHTFEKTTKKKPTCTQVGIQYYNCKGCGKPKTEEIPALGHKWVADPENSYEPTCLWPGVEAYKCSRKGCNGTKEIPLGRSMKYHNFEVTYNFEGTCQKQRYREETCEYCGEVRKYWGDINDSNHEDVHVEKIEEATCQHGTLTWSRCRKCNCQLVDQADDRKDHELVFYLFELKYKCKYCGREECGYNDHKWELYDYVFKPTCTKNGRGKFRCERCGATKEELVPRQHNPGDWKVYIEPTETKEGVERRVCKDCKCVVEQRDIPKLTPSSGDRPSTTGSGVSGTGSHSTGGKRPVFTSGSVTPGQSSSTPTTTTPSGSSSGDRPTGSTYTASTPSGSSSGDSRTKNVTASTSGSLKSSINSTTSNNNVISNNSSSGSTGTKNTNGSKLGSALSGIISGAKTVAKSSTSTTSMKTNSARVVKA